MVRRLTTEGSHSIGGGILAPKDVSRSHDAGYEQGSQSPYCCCTKDVVDLLMQTAWPVGVDGERALHESGVRLFESHIVFERKPKRAQRHTALQKARPSPPSKGVDRFS